MQKIRHSVVLRGTPQEVFRQLAHVPNFTCFCDHVTEIVDLGDNQWRWTVEVLGRPFSFDVEVTESVEPDRFAWRSIRGIRNSGAYHLSREDASHTRVAFELQYQLGSTLLEMAARRAAGSLVERISGQMLDRVQQAVDRHREPTSRDTPAPISAS
ncbi:MAG: SRPBCC family protein [Thioalkalivibrionaceae bacterium]